MLQANAQQLPLLEAPLTVQPEQHTGCAVQITGPKEELDSLKEELSGLNPTYFEEV